MPSLHRESTDSLIFLPLVMWFGVCKSGYRIRMGWFDRAKLDMLILIRIPFSFHVAYVQSH